MPHPVPKPRLEREVRLGLVLYGGVSLAVYINGVAQEMFRAVRGRGVYRLLKALTDSDIVVDVVSGASAGGVNATLLAYALCNRCELAGTADLWRDGADIEALLHEPGTPRAAFTSAFDGEKAYRGHLEAAFDRMWRAPGGPDGGWDSGCNELDLFIAGTDVHGRTSTHVGDGGPWQAQAQLIDVKDHRAVFWLKHREGRKEQLHPQRDAWGRAAAAEPPAAIGHEALAKLARLTSSFPGAFPAVAVSPPQDDGGGDVDRRLGVWGAVKRPTHFLDGGILDNKPFTGALDTIYRRLATRPVRRVLFYVEPDPERIEPQAPTNAPTFVQSIIAGAVGIPSYESIDGDLRRVAEHNAKVARYEQARAQARREGGASFTGLYRAARLDDLTDRLLACLLDTDAPAALGEADKAALSRTRASLRAKTEAAFPSAASLARFDVAYALRRALHLTYVREVCAHERLLAALNGLIELLEILQSGLDGVLRGLARDRLQTGCDEDVARLWAVVCGRVTVFLGTTGLDFGTQTLDQDYLGRASALVRAVVASPPTSGPRPAPFTSLLDELDAYLVRMLDEAPALTDDERQAKQVARAELAAFPAVDAQLFPLEHVADLRQRDHIEVVRVSPIDAQKGLSSRTLTRKVRGLDLGHFGAFLERSWRANDLLWGRLDGACRVIETLLTAERVQGRAGRVQELLRQLAPRRADLDALVPAHDAALHARVVAWLAELWSGDVRSSRGGWDARVADLIEATQRQILDEDLAEVVGDDAASIARDFRNAYVVPDQRIRDLPKRRLLHVATKTLIAVFHSVVNSFRSKRRRR